MNEITVHLGNGQPIDIHIDGAAPVAINAFVLLTSVPVVPPASHIISYGNSDTIGRLLFSFWSNSVNKNPDGAWVIEQVARDIIKAAKEARGVPWSPDSGNAH